jgi:hypothetical protein
MVDIDGRGMVAVDGPNGSLSNTFGSYFERGDEIGLSHPNTPLRLPAGPQTIEVGFAGATGLIHGPWRYEFDPATVVADTAVTGDLPVVACSGDRLVPRVARPAMQRQTLCLALQPTDFFEVASVAFGEAPGQFTEVIEIDFTADEYLDTACDAFNGPCPPFRFEVPEDWTNIYSRITMRDGRVLSRRGTSFNARTRRATCCFLSVGSKATLHCNVSLSFPRGLRAISLLDVLTRRHTPVASLKGHPPPSLPSKNPSFTLYVFLLLGNRALLHKSREGFIS